MDDLIDDGFHDLFRRRKPGPLGQVRDNRPCHKTSRERFSPLAGLARLPVSAGLAEA
jgi:hypothetical protein